MISYRMSGGNAHYAPVPGGGKVMQSFMPGQIVQVDEVADTEAVEFYDRWVNEGLAERVNEAVTPLSPAGPAGSAGALPGTLADRMGTPVVDAEAGPEGLAPNELPGTDADLAAGIDEVPAKATGDDGVVSWLATDLDPAERRRRADLAEQAEQSRGTPRGSVLEAIDRARARADADEAEGEPPPDVA